MIAARFLDGPRGRIFAMLRRPRATSGSAVLIVPPFAEEMNKSRRMLAQVMQALAASGIAAVVADFYGTGDSEGEFGDGDGECWIGDLRRAAAWSAAEGWPVNAMLCVRLGCILGASAGLPGIRRTVFWQPVLDGERFFTQFLRLRVAASMMSDDGKETAEQLRSQLASGSSLEVSGYEISARLAADVDRLRLEAHTGSHLGELHWAEIVRAADAPLPTPSTRLIEKLSHAGLPVQAHRIVGEPFWSSTEIVSIAALVDATVRALAGQRDER